jgi:hypothetical protein
MAAWDRDLTLITLARNLVTTGLLAVLFEDSRYGVNSCYWVYDDLKSGTESCTDSKDGV